MFKKSFTSGLVLDIQHIIHTNRSCNMDIAKSTWTNSLFFHCHLSYFNLILLALDSKCWIFRKKNPETFSFDSPGTGVKKLNFRRKDDIFLKMPRRDWEGKDLIRFLKT